MNCPKCGSHCEPLHAKSRFHWCVKCAKDYPDYLMVPEDVKPEIKEKESHGIFSKLRGLVRAWTKEN